MTSSPTAESRVAAGFFILFFVAPLTIYLGMPPIINAGTAQQECEQIAEEQLDAATVDAEVRWTRLPLAQWECFVEDRLVGRLGWLASSTSDESVDLLE
jgi:hypothetical protein